MVDYLNRPSRANQVARCGEVLFARMQSTSKVLVIDGDLDDCIYSTGFAVVSPREGMITTSCLKHLLLSDAFQAAKDGLCTGATQRAITNAGLGKLKVNIPPYEEQESISSKLDHVFQLLEAQQTMLIKLDELVESRFVEMFGDPDNNGKGFPVDTLGSLLLIERGGSPRPISQYVTDDPDGVNWIKIGDAEEGSIYITHTAEKIKKSGTKQSRHVIPGDFLLSNSMSFGRPYILKIDGYIHDGWLVLRDSNGLFDKMYLHALLSSDYAMREFAKRAAGTTVKNLNKNIVGSVPVPVPPLALQQEFSVFVQQVDKSKFAVQQTIDKLELLKASLMQKYFG